MPQPCRSRCKCTCEPEKPMLPPGKAWMLVPTLHEQLLIWALQLIFRLFRTRIKDGYPDLFSVCSWDEPGQMQSSSSQCWLPPALESPTSLLFIFGYLGYLIAFLHILVTLFDESAKLKDATFRLLFIIIPIMTCLSSFSGYITFPN
jgi:hypothetical protein